MFHFFLVLTRLLLLSLATSPLISSSASSRLLLNKSIQACLRFLSAHWQIRKSATKGPPNHPRTHATARHHHIQILPFFPRSRFSAVAVVRFSFYDFRLSRFTWRIFLRPLWLAAERIASSKSFSSASTLRVGCRPNSSRRCVSVRFPFRDCVWSNKFYDASPRWTWWIARR